MRGVTLKPIASARSREHWESGNKRTYKVLVVNANSKAFDPKENQPTGGLCQGKLRY
jgi:hypothetical protein